MKLDRRSMLRLAGGTAAATMAGTAGCLDTVGLGNTGTATYSSWLAAGDTDDETFYAYVDWAAFEQFDDLEPESNPEEDEIDDEAVADRDDPMLAAPLLGVVVVSFGASFTLMGTGLTDLVAVDDESAFETSVDDVLLTDEVVVLTGDVDTDEIDETLVEPPESEWDVKTEYEQTTTIDGFSVYEPTDEDGFGMGFSEDETVAVGNDALLFANGSDDAEAIDQLRNAIGAHAGDEQRQREVNEDIEWLLTEAGSGHVAIGSYGNPDTDDDLEADEELEELDGARGFTASLTIEGPSKSTGEFAAIFDDLDEDVEATLETEVGSTAASVEYEVDGDRIVSTATWEEDVADL
ncbi:hypothetical protein [Natronobacterium texcoconense]|uniref:Uncharacterized protein n=1 Tax=Natronobacterium texcoconense TaxID=1095778 RepID=A0A1H1GF74_NATTX|nr:hypothetical protein [Natronobacterium texcoconense]SDR11496.1 hypothetical protein SAMN04489842_2390 [Natronobacterium texcoconense]